MGIFDGGGSVEAIEFLDRMNRLLTRCKCGVSIEINEHRTLYASAADYILESMENSCPPEIEDGVRAKMVEHDSIVVIHFYPDTPVGFYEVWDWNLDRALRRCMAILEVL